MMPHSHGDKQPDVRGDRISLGVANLTAAIGDHIGHFYQTKEEWRALMVPFLSDGLTAGHRCVYVVSPDHPQVEIEDALARVGADVGKAVSSGQLLMGEGKKTPEQMQEWLMEAMGEPDGRFPITRWAADMTWSLKSMPTSSTLMKWESACNLVHEPRAVFLCQYNVNRFPGNVVVDAFKTHPLCIVGSAIHHNPLYMDPEAFLEELDRRPETA